MKEYKIAERDNGIYPMGLTRLHDGAHWNVSASGSECALLLFHKEEEKPFYRLVFPEEQRQGDVFGMTVLGSGFDGLEYCFSIDGKEFPDPYGRQFTGRDVWGDLEAVKQPMRTLMLREEFDWEGDKPLKLLYEDTIVYQAHVRGFTMHPSHKGRNKGTFRALEEKISYWKELGITALLLLPVNEFPEVMMHDGAAGNPYGRKEPAGKLNYWGYTPGFYFAPKAAYSSGKEKHPVRELKSLVKALHKEGIELVLQLYFTGKENPSFVLDAVRYWVKEFHVDGIHLVGHGPYELIGRDPYLSDTKLFAASWEGIPKGRRKHLAEYNDGFLIDMRRALKGDEDEMSLLIGRSRLNPENYGVINYMAETNGFTMSDMVSYDTKHNEGNGEGNRDGNPYNFSWNCGVEGVTKRKKILQLRHSQLKNAFLMLLLSQGTPLIQAGDEFGHSKSGNNNSYCQDNEVSWLNWNLLRTNRDLYDFVRRVIAFRKAHPVFHMEREPKIMDYLSCGQPDVSYHGVRAWRPEFENFRRQIGIMYCGEYGRLKDKTADNSFYVAYNMHWEPHTFDLPNLPKGHRWRLAFRTDEKLNSENRSPEGEASAETETDSRRFQVPPRTIAVFMGS